MDRVAASRLQAKLEGLSDTPAQWAFGGTIPVMLKEAHENMKVGNWSAAELTLDRALAFLSASRCPGCDG